MSDAEFTRGDAYRAIAEKIKAEPLGEFYGEAALIYFHDALEAGETPRMALAMSNKETEWPELSPDDNKASTKAFSELTSLSAALLMGNHLGPLYKICEGQSSISTSKLQKLVHDLQEHDRKLAVALLGVRDQLSPDDNSDTVPMPRELNAEDLPDNFIDLMENRCGRPLTLSWAEIKAIYKAAVAHFHPVSDSRGDSE